LKELGLGNRKLPYVNKSDMKETPVLDDVSYEIIKDVYEKDIEYFGY
jgi:hypothetical protein